MISRLISVFTSMWHVLVRVSLLFSPLKNKSKLNCEITMPVDHLLLVLTYGNHTFYSFVLLTLRPQFSRVTTSSDIAVYELLYLGRLPSLGVWLSTMMAPLFFLSFFLPPFFVA